MNVHLKALGCRLNEAELEQWSEQLQQRGARLTHTPDNADLTVLNTCAVTGAAVKKSRQLIRRLHAANPQGKLVVSGCYISLEGQQEAAKLGIDLVVPNNEKDRLVDIALRDLSIAASHSDAGPVHPRRGRTRAFIKVQDGCRYRCSYCIVTIARGLERSRPATDIIKEINRLHESGIKEVVLTGVHLGGYGSDRQSSLPELITTVLQQTAIPRLRLGSLEPWQLADNFFALFSNPRLMPHLHLPLQSGSDTILRRMSRRCRTDEFEQLVASARASRADFNITTDIIVGFPGETAADWEKTLAFCASVGFGGIHIFPFSARSGTKAATLPDMPDRATKKKRVQELSNLDQQLRTQALKSLNGQTNDVLFEARPAFDRQNRQRYFGYTPHFLRVACDYDKPLTGQLMNVLIGGICPIDGVALARLQQ